MSHEAEKKESIFGKKKVNRLRSPDELQNYISVTSPSVWIVLGAIIIFLVGVLGWCVFGQIPLTCDTVVLSDSGTTICIVSVDDISDVNVGDEVEVGDQILTVKSVPTEPSLIDESFPSYAYVCKIGGYTAGEYVYKVALEGTCSSGISNAKITTGYLTPITFITN